MHIELRKVVVATRGESYKHIVSPAELVDLMLNTKEELHIHGGNGISIEVNVLLMGAHMYWIKFPVITNGTRAATVMSIHHVASLFFMLSTNA